ncbi:MAG: hypothetical protein Q9168_006896 [Polycauliona sp. 1 TL-2023]
MISHLVSQLDDMVSTTTFEGNDSIVFLFARLTNLRKGLQRLRFDLKNLDLLINETIAHNTLRASQPPRQYVYLVRMDDRDNNKVHVMETALSGRIKCSWPIELKDISMDWSSDSNKLRVYNTKASQNLAMQTQALVPDPSGTVHFLEFVNRSDTLKAVDKLSTIGKVKTVTLKTRDEMDALYAIRPRDPPAMYNYQLC